jgi:hypothetical protein
MSPNWLKQLFARKTMTIRSRSRRARKQQRNRSPLTLEVLEDRTLPSVTVSGVPAWVEQGPGVIQNGQVTGIPNSPVIGAVEAVAPDPADPNVLFVGAVNGGVWRTTDATSAAPQWTPLTDDLSSLSVAALDLDPTDPTGNTLIAGIGRTSSAGRDGGDLTGALYSTNARDPFPSWIPLTDNLVNRSVSAVAARGSTLLVATRSYYSDVSGGLYRSTDTRADLFKAGTFQLVNPTAVPGSSGLPAGDIYDLVGDPGDPKRFYVAVANLGVFTSDDTGATWTATAGLPAIEVDTNNIKMAIHHSPGNDVVYVGVVNSGRLTGISWSTDNGATWNPMDLPQTLEGSSAITDVTGAGVSPIVITSNNHGLKNGDRVRIGGVMGNAAANGDFTVTVVNANQFSLDSTIGNGDYTGGGTWSRIEGLQPGAEGEDDEEAGGQGTIHFSIAADPTHPNFVYLGGDTQVGRPNSAGATNSTGRLFRGDRSIAPTGTIPSLEWTAITDDFANPTAGAPHAISDASNALPILITSNNHGLQNGDRVIISGATGNTAANGAFSVTVKDADSFWLDGSMGNGAYLGGGTWRKVLPGATAPHADSRNLAFTADGTLLDVCDGGVYRRSDPTLSTGVWTSVNGDLRVTEFFSVAYDSFVGRIVGGTQDNGSPLQDQMDDLPWSLLAGGDGGIVAVDNSSLGPEFYYMADGPGGFFHNGIQVKLAKSVGGTVASGFNAVDRALANGADFSPFPYILSSTDPRLMLLGNSGLYEDGDPSFANGLTGDVITDLTAQLPGYVGINGKDDNKDGIVDGPGEGESSITALAYGGRLNGVNEDRVAYVGTSIGELFVRTSVHNVLGPFTASPSPPFAGAYVRDIVLDPDDYRTAYVLDGYNRIWRTTDAGATAAGWTELTYNLGSLTHSVRTLELYDASPGSQPGDSVLLAGGLGGVYRFVTGPSGTGWAQYGAGMPNALVTDLHYIPPNSNAPSRGDFLLAGTLGRGAWTLPNVSDSIRQTAVLEIDGDTDAAGENDTISLGRDALKPRYLDVTVNPPQFGGGITYQILLAPIEQILVRGLGGNDQLFLNFAGDPIAPVYGISFDGGAGNNSLSLDGGTFATATYSPTSITLDQTSITLGQTRIDYSGLQSVTDTNRADKLVVNGEDTLHLVDGPALADSGGPVQTTEIQDNRIGHPLTLDFANKANVTVHGPTGDVSDVITVNLAKKAAGLNTLRLDGMGTAGNYFNFLGTAAGTTTIVNTGSQGGVGDNVTIGNSSSGVQDIQGKLTITNGKSNTVTVTVDDSADATGRSAAAGWDSLTGLASAEIDYTGTALAALNITLGTGNDTMTVTPSPYFPATVNGNGPSFPTIPGDTLTLDVPPPTTVGLGTLYPTGVAAGKYEVQHREPVTYSGMENVTTTGGPYDLTLDMTTAGFAGGTGTDTVRAQLDDTGTALQLLVGDNGATPPLLFNGASAPILSLGVTGSADDDSLFVDFTNGILSQPISYDGGGLDNQQNELTLNGGGFVNENVTVKDGHSGRIQPDGVTIDFTNLTPIHDLTHAVNFTLNATDAADTINVVDGPTIENTRTTQINSGTAGTFELLDFANKTNVTVNALGGSDHVTVNNPNPAPGLQRLTIDGGGPGTPPGDTLSYIGPGTVTPDGSGSGGSITAPGYITIHYTNIQTFDRIITAGSHAGDGVADTFRVVRNGSNVAVYVDTDPTPIYSTPWTSLSPLHIQGSTDPDTLRVDASAGEPIPLGGLVFDAVGGGNTVLADYHTFTANSTWTVSPTQLTHSFGFLSSGLRSSAVQNLQVAAGSGAATVTFDFQTDPDSAATWLIDAGSVARNGAGYNARFSAGRFQGLTLHAGAGDDTILLSPGAEDLQVLAPSLTIDGGGGSNSLILHDEKHKAATQWAVTGAAVARGDGPKQKAPVSVAYANLQAVEIHAGTANDAVSVGPDPQQPVPLPAQVTVDGGGGNKNQLTVTYAADATPSTWTVTAAQVSRDAGGVHQNSLFYSQVQALELDAGSGSDTINVPATIADTTIKAGAGLDAISVGGPGGSLDDLRAPVTVDGGGDADALSVNDRQNTNGSQWTIDAAQVQRIYTATDASGHPITVNRRVKYTSVETVAVNAGTGADTFDVGGSSQNLDALPQHVVIDGGGASDQASLNDQQATSATAWQVTGGKATRTTATRTSDISYSAVEAVAVHGGQQDDAFTVAHDTQGLDDLPPTVSLDGGAGSNNRLTVDDSGPAADAAPVAWAVTAAEVDRSHGSHSAAITYARMSALTVNGGAAPDMIDVRATVVDTTIDAGDGADTITAGAGNNNLDNLQAKLTVRGGAGQDNLVINDRNNAQPATWTVTADEVDRTVATITRTINYSGVEAVEADAGSGPDTIAVAGTSAPTTLRGGGGADAFSVGAGTNNLDGIQGSVTVDGEAGVNQLQVNDQANANSATLGVTGSVVTRVNQAPAGSVPVTIQYANIGNLTLTTGSASTFDNLKVLGTSAATTVNIVAGLDEIDVGNLAHTLDDLHGVLTIPVGYIVQVNDQGTSSPQSYSLTAGSVARGGATINYGSVVALTLNGGSGGGASGFAIQGTSAPQTVVVTGTGQDNVSVTGNAAGVALSVYDATGGLHDLITLGGGTLAGLQGDILLASVARHLTVDDRNDSTPRTFTIGDTSSTVLAPAPLRYSALGMDFYLGGGGNTVTVLGANGGLLTVHGNTGPDHVTVAIANDLFAHTVRFEGQAGDTLTIDDSARTAGYRYTLTDSAVARVRTTIQYVGVDSVLLKGTQGDDTFQIVGTPGVPLTLYGLAGANTLDYSAYPTGVVVNLSTGTATGLAGIANIANVVGSAFDDVLVGDAGNNALTGGAGRDLLIGGQGADQLDGGAGDDILIGGSTIDDANPGALHALQQEWTRTDEDSGTRINHLRNGGGLNDPYRLNASTVVDDGVADTLTGGLGQDWFWVNPGQDTRDNQPEDQVN